MGIFKFLKREQQQPTMAFSYPRNEEGIKQIIAWLKDSGRLIMDVTETGQLAVKMTPDGQKCLIAYTNLSQRVPAYRKNERFIEIGYEGLVELFEENYELALLWLNPHSDSAQINRQTFTAAYRIAEKTKVQIGQPAKPPVAVIDFLVAYAKTEPSIASISLALMYNQEFSYLIFIDSPENKTIVPKIGPNISEICQTHKISYPVDFTYTNEFLNEPAYLIYHRD